MSQIPDGTLVFRLQPPTDLGTHEQALIMDATKYGIGLGLNPYDDSVGVGCYVTNDGIVIKRPKEPASPISRVSPQSPNPMATGGHVEPAFSNVPGRLVTPLSTPVPSPAVPSYPSQSHVGGSSVASSDPLSAERRQIHNSQLVKRDSMYTIHELKDHQEAFKPSSYGSIGYSLHFHVDYLKNIEQYMTSDPVWEVLQTKGNSGPQLIRLMLDTAAGDSWTFCDLLPKDFPMHVDPTNLRIWNSTKIDVGFLYRTKPTFPRPPAHMMGATQRATIRYGVTEQATLVTTTQTVCRLRIPGQDHDFDMFPIGLALSAEVTMLWRVDDGILALGPGTTPLSLYSREVNWRSEPFHAFLFRKKKISAPAFWVCIGHPHFDPTPRTSTFIVFGNFYHPSWSDLGTTDAFKYKFTRVPIHVPVDSASGGNGKWIVFLKQIILVPYDQTKCSRQDATFNIGQPVILDTGAAQSYLPPDVAPGFDELFVKLGARTEGTLPDFHIQDQVMFVFRDETRGRDISISGQAKRFFTPVLPCRPDMIQTNVGTSGSVLLLGLNFFRTFIVGFDESGEEAVYLHWQLFY